jgi:hypothetical protein
LRPRRAHAAAARNLICVLQTGGYIQSAWRPSVGPLAPTLPTSCQPLEPHKGDLIFLPELTDPSMTSCTLATCGRLAYGTIFYGLPSVGGGTYKEPLGPTVDQVVAAGLGGRPSLALGVQLDRLPQFTTALGGRRCFWSGAGRPISPQLDPHATYQSLFTGPSADPQLIRRLIAEKKSLLDYVGRSLEQFATYVGTSDRPPVQAHLQSIRDLERLLDVRDPAALSACARGVSIPQVDVVSAGAYPTIVALQLQLAVIALACGVTSAATLQLSDAGGANVDVRFVGVQDIRNAPPTWLSVSRDPTTAGLAGKRMIDQWCMERFASLLQLLKSRPEGSGTMLDSTVVLWANHMDDGRAQSAQKIPWILAGKAGGYFKTGQCASSSGRPLTGVLAEICNALGVAAHPFGAALDGLRA